MTMLHFDPVRTFAAIAFALFSATANAQCVVPPPMPGVPSGLTAPEGLEVAMDRNGKKTVERCTKGKWVVISPAPPAKKTAQKKS